MNGYNELIWDVIIIGAGVAGLQCANAFINSSNKKILIVEGSNRIGGRILQDYDFLPNKYPVEIGAEFLHGKNTILTKMVQDSHWKTKEICTWAQGDGGPSEPSIDGGIGYYYISDEKRMITSQSNDLDFCYLNETLWKMADLDEKETNNDKRSIFDYLKDKNVSSSMISLAESGYGNTAGSCLKNLSFSITCKYERQWAPEGEGDYRLIPSMNIVIEKLKEKIMKSKHCKILLNWPVHVIIHKSKKNKYITIYRKNNKNNKIININNNHLRCKKIVITIPITMYENIKFYPKLPKKKLKILKNQIGMGKCLKIILLFSKPFWPNNMHGCICSIPTFIPEFWVQSIDTFDFINQTENNINNNDTSTKYYVLTGFAVDTQYEVIRKLTKSTMNEDLLIQNFLEQLNEIFGTNDNTTPATDVFIKGKLYDWSKIEYICGGYSYPKIGQSLDAIKILSKNINNKIFFAGEGMSYTMPGMTVHSAMETGEKAALEILAL